MISVLSQDVYFLLKIFDGFAPAVLQHISLHTVCTKVHPCVLVKCPSLLTNNTCFIVGISYRDE